MEIIVLVKQVPDTTEMSVDKETGTLIRTGVPSIINPDDLAGVEEALKLKDQIGAHVTVITMGPPQAESMLRELYARGVDEAILISDRRFAGADTCATSTTLGALIKTMKYDLIIAGRQAIDGDTAQVGPQTAEKLQIPQITYVDQIVSISSEKIVVRKAYEDYFEVIESTLPCLITTLSDMNSPRYMNCNDIWTSFDKDIKKINFDDLNLDLSSVGLKGSPTKVKATFVKSLSKVTSIYELSSDLSSKKIIDFIKEKQLIS